jgi:hypothetical protein
MFQNWKTTLAGVGGSLLIIINAASGQHLTAKQWGLAILQAAATVVMGALAKDHSK